MTPRLRLRPASPEDRNALGALKLRSSLAWGDHIDELLALPEARQVPAAHLPFIVVAELAGEVVGFATILPENEDMQAELEDMFVAPTAWRKGVGRRLLLKAEGRAIARGARFVRVVAGERARPFYEACGYRVIGTVMTKFAPALEMRKDLRQTRGGRPDTPLHP